MGEYQNLFQMGKGAVVAQSVWTLGYGLDDWDSIHGEDNDGISGRCEPDSSIKGMVFLD